VKKNQPESRDVLYLWAFLNQTRDAMQKLRQKELKPLNISPIEAIVMLLLGADNSGAAPVELSRWLFREPQSVSGLLNRMQRKKLIKKVKDKTNRSGIKVILTPEGVEIRDKAVVYKSIRTLISSTFSDEEIKTLASYLMRLRNNALEKLNMKDMILLPVPHLNIPAEYRDHSEIQ
jgi:MarR family transcriptional regulator, organic hydroperoxide resistance regulator